MSEVPCSDHSRLFGPYLNLNREVSPSSILQVGEAAFDVWKKTDAPAYQMVMDAFEVVSEVP